MAKDIRPDLARAGALHQSGRLDEAVALYRSLLKASPEAFEAARLLVLALLQSGRLGEAHAAARKARDAHRGNAHAHLLLGAVRQAEGKPEKALDSFEKARALDPALVEAQYMAANALLQLGRLPDAVERYDRALALRPQLAEALANRAVALSRLGRPEAALADCDRLVALDPRDPQRHISRAGTLLELGRFAEATRAAEAARVLAPKLADAHFLKGQGLAGQADIDGAAEAFAAAVNIAPDRPTFQAALVRSERQRGRLDEALRLAEAATAGTGGSPALFQELAELRRERREPADAFDAVDKALALDPRSAGALTAKARLLIDRGEHAAARGLVDAALDADPAFPMARYLRAADDLAEGRWAEGWAEYESRASFLPPPYRPLPFARWDGQSVPDELVVVGEQGTGDHIMFGRLLRLLAERGIRTRFLTKARLVPLLSRIDARVRVVSSLDDLDTTAPGLAWVPLASLPRLIAPDPTLWPQAPYLNADPERVGRWTGRFGDGFTIGISWQGDPSAAVDVGRSVPLDLFAPLAALDGVRLVSLQQGVGAEQLDGCAFGDRVARLGPECDADGAFVDTAAILQHIDLVVTIDTALAHLAGARGRPALVALKVAPEWRWGREGERTPLYSSLRLMRQDVPGDFAGVFDRIAHRVRALQRGDAL
jgi:tetratricopeptide (TPR) repeat protein